MVSGVVVEAVSVVCSSVETGDSVELDEEVMSVAAVFISCVDTVFSSGVAVAKGVTLDVVPVSVEAGPGVPVEWLTGSDDISSAVVPVVVALVTSAVVPVPAALVTSFVVPVLAVLVTSAVVPLPAALVTSVGLAVGTSAVGAWVGLKEVAAEGSPVVGDEVTAMDGDSTEGGEVEVGLGGVPLVSGAPSVGLCVLGGPAGSVLAALPSAVEVTKELADPLELPTLVASGVV